MARILDLERQLFEVPSRPLLCRIFNCLLPSKLFSRLFRDTKNRSTGDKLNNENSRVIGIGPKRPPHTSVAALDYRSSAKSVQNLNRPEIKISAITKDSRMIATHKSISSTKSGRPSAESAANRTKYSTIKDRSEQLTHDPAFSAKPALSFKISTAHRTKSATGTDDKTLEISRHLITPPQKVYKVTSSKHVGSLIGSVVYYHGHVTSSSNRLALEPIRPASKPAPSQATAHQQPNRF